jgi:hypothetical protein
LIAIDEGIGVVTVLMHKPNEDFLKLVSDDQRLNFDFDLRAYVCSQDPSSGSSGLLDLRPSLDEIEELLRPRDNDSLTHLKERFSKAEVLLEKRCRGFLSHADFRLSEFQEHYLRKLNGDIVGFKLQMETMGRSIAERIAGAKLLTERDIRLQNSMTEVLSGDIQEISDFDFIYLRPAGDLAFGDMDRSQFKGYDVLYSNVNFEQDKNVFNRAFLFQFKSGGIPQNLPTVEVEELYYNQLSALFVEDTYSKMDSGIKDLNIPSPQFEMKRRELFEAYRKNPLERLELARKQFDLYFKSLDHCIAKWPEHQNRAIAQALLSPSFDEFHKGSDKVKYNYFNEINLEKVSPLATSADFAALNDSLDHLGCYFLMENLVPSTLTHIRTFLRKNPGQSITQQDIEDFSLRLVQVRDHARFLEDGKSWLKSKGTERVPAELIEWSEFRRQTTQFISRSVKLTNVINMLPKFLHEEKNMSKEFFSN